VRSTSAEMSAGAVTVVSSLSALTQRVRCYPGRPRAPLAQLAEQRTLNPQVLGSSPRGGTHEGPGQNADQGLLGSPARCKERDP
jgi:hypothetical protein